MTQLIWQRSDVVSQRSVREVLKLTCAVEPVGVVRVEHGLDGTFADERPSDPRRDPVAGHVGEFLVHEQRGISAALADEIAVQPLLGDALELAEEVEFRLLARIAPFRVQQPLGDMEKERGRTHVAQMLQIVIDTFADDAGVAGLRRPDQIGTEFEDESSLNSASAVLRAIRPGSLRRAGNGFPARRGPGGRL